MPLTLQSQLVGDVVVIRCHGRIVAGAEVDSLQAEFEKQIRVSRKFVLQLEQTDYLDSSGLGALVRVFGVLKGAGGDLKICRVRSHSPYSGNDQIVDRLSHLIRR